MKDEVIVAVRASKANRKKKIWVLYTELFQGAAIPEKFVFDAPIDIQVISDGATIKVYEISNIMITILYS